MFRVDPDVAPDDGEDPDARHVGARPAPDASSTSSATVTSVGCARRRSCSTTASSRSRRGALVVHCAASGLQNPPMVPIWGTDRIRLQTIRVGFPCFCAALAGYVEATRDDDGSATASARRTCTATVRPSGRGCRRRARSRRRPGRGPDIAAWANGCALNPAHVVPELLELPAAEPPAPAWPPSPPANPTTTSSLSPAETVKRRGHGTHGAARARGWDPPRRYRLDLHHAGTTVTHVDVGTISQPSSWKVPFCVSAPAGEPRPRDLHTQGRRLPTCGTIASRDPPG